MIDISFLIIFYITYRIENKIIVLQILENKVFKKYSTLRKVLKYFSALKINRNSNKTLCKIKNYW